MSDAVRKVIATEARRLGRVIGEQFVDLPPPLVAFGADYAVSACELPLQVSLGAVDAAAAKRKLRSFRRRGVMRLQDAGLYARGERIEMVQLGVNALVRVAAKVLTT